MKTFTSITTQFVFLLTDDISYKRARGQYQFVGNPFMKNIRCLLKISAGFVLRSDRKQGACQGTAEGHNRQGFGDNTNQVWAVTQARVGTRS